jgi:hypothetical protein
MNGTGSHDGKGLYTTSFAFFEAIWEAGVTHCFVNLGSDHPSIMEAIVKGQNERKDQFPKIITCPTEVCSYSVSWSLKRYFQRGCISARASYGPIACSIFTLISV